MNEQEKKEYLDRYHAAKQKGEKFWPDQIYSDLLVMFAVFILLVGLATFLGVAGEPKADPSDSNYIPRPEWYFLFLFQMLKFFPGALEWIGTAVLPGIAVGALFLLPFLDRSPHRHYSKRMMANGIMALIVIGIVALTVWAEYDTRVALAKQAAEGGAEEGFVANSLSEQITGGNDFYSVYCVECHGAEGEGGEIKGVEGLEGKILPPLNSVDVMYTFTDETMQNIIAYGQPDQGMPPFAKQFGGELGPGEVEAIAAFMRYTWDDRAEMPAEAAQSSSIPALKEGEVPSYEVHIAAISKRYCISCHRPGKKNNEYLMGSYDEIVNSGENAPNMVAGDPAGSTLIRMLHREEELEAGGPMPPTKALKPEFVIVFEKWVAAGMPNTAADAAALAVPAPATTP